MARIIYEVKLSSPLFPANSYDEAGEMMMNSAGLKEYLQDDYSVRQKVSEEHTVKLFTLARTLNETEKFDYREVQVMVRALAQELGYVQDAEEIAECVVAWNERLEELDESEFIDWLFG